MLPLFYKTLIEMNPYDNLDDFTYSIYEKFSQKSSDIKKLLEAIISLKDIPIELLSKYYTRIYTMGSDFYRDMNRDLGTNKKENHLLFIKTLYEGTKLKVLSNKIKDLPGAIVYSK